MSQIICRSERVCVAVFFKFRLDLQYILLVPHRFIGMDRIKTGPTSWMVGVSTWGAEFRLWYPSNLTLPTLIGTSGITECGIIPGSTFTYNWTVQNVGTL